MQVQPGAERVHAAIFGKSVGKSPRLGKRGPEQGGEQRARKEGSQRAGSPEQAVRYFHGFSGDPDPPAGAGKCQPTPCEAVRYSRYYNRLWPRLSVIMAGSHSTFTVAVHPLSPLQTSPEAQP